MPPPAEAPSFRDTVVFETSLVRVGAFRCDADHPAFRHSDPIQNHCVWFSRTPVVIQPERERAFVANGHIAVFYNRAQSFGRVRVDTDGDYSDWFAIDEAAAYDILDACAPNIHPRDHPFPWSYVRVNAQTYLQQRRLFQAATSGSPQDRLAIEEGTIRLVHQLVAKALAADARSRSTVIRPRHRDLVHETERLLSRTCEESISLTALAKQVGSSVYQLVPRLPPNHGHDDAPVPATPAPAHDARGGDRTARDDHGYRRARRLSESQPFHVRLPTGVRSVAVGSPAHSGPRVQGQLRGASKSRVGPLDPRLVDCAEEAPYASADS
jgi:hypothetical protein